MCKKADEQYRKTLDTSVKASGTDSGTDKVGFFEFNRKGQGIWKLDSNGDGVWNKK